MARPAGDVDQADLRLLLGGQWLAQAGDGLAQAAFADALILEPLGAGTPQRILSLFALTLLPYSAVAPFLGVFVDRWPRRGLLTWTSVARAVLLLSLPVWTDRVPGDTSLYVAVLALLGLGRLFLTTKGACLPYVLHEHHLLRGNAISSGGGMIAALVGGIVGVWITASFGLTPAYLGAGGAFVCSAVAVRFISRAMAHPRARRPQLSAAVAEVARELGEGLKAAATRARVGLPLVAIFLLRAVGVLVAIVAILLIKHEFPEAADRAGRLSASAIALAAAGAGALLGALTTPRLGRRLDEARLILLGFVISGVTIAALGSVLALPALLGLVFVGGYSGFVAKVSVDALVQENLADELRGRGFSIYDILYNAASVMAAATVVAAAELSLRVLLIVTGTVTLGLGVVVGAGMRRAGMLEVLDAR